MIENYIPRYLYFEKKDRKTKNSIPINDSIEFWFKNVKFELGHVIA